MPDYSELELVNDPSALVELGVDYLETAIPGFDARPASVETVLLEATAEIGAEVVQQAAQVPPEVVAYLGRSLYGIPMSDAAAATATATITWAVDPPAAAIFAGAMIAVPHPAGGSIIFTLDDDVAAIPAGGAIQSSVTALEPGAAANGARGDSELVDVTDGVLSVYVNTAVGGTDEEATADYLDRLVDALTLLAPRPILPADHATLARQVPGVGRTAAIDLYQPGTSDGPPGPIGAPLAGVNGVGNVARCCTTIVTAEGGQPPTVALMQTVWDELDARREVNFLEYVMSPRYSTVDVKATVHPYPGVAAADVIAAATAMLETWLDPGVWGSSATSTTDEAQAWTVDSFVRIYEAVDWLNRAEGVHYVVNGSVQLRIAGGAYTGADLPLPGAAPMTLPGTMTVVVG